jgi:hypothetical protein
VYPEYQAARSSSGQPPGSGPAVSRVLGKYRHVPTSAMKRSFVVHLSAMSPGSGSGSGRFSLRHQRRHAAHRSPTSPGPGASPTITQGRASHVGSFQLHNGRLSGQRAKALHCCPHSPAAMRPIPCDSCQLSVRRKRRLRRHYAHCQHLRCPLGLLGMSHGHH